MEASQHLQEGEALILGDKYRVMWRFSVFGADLAVFIVSSSNDSVYAALEILDDVAAIMSSMAQGVDLSPDKIKGRYNEAFARINIALCTPGSRDLSSIVLGHKIKKANDLRETESARKDMRALMKLRQIDISLESVSNDWIRVGQIDILVQTFHSAHDLDIRKTNILMCFRILSIQIDLKASRECRNLQRFPG